MQGDLSKLIERVENATGPDRELDLELANVAGWRCDGDWLYTPDGAMAAFTADSPPAYTSSLDAALALVEEKLPGWTRLVDATAPELGICVELFPSDDIAERTESARGDHNRETHATLLALLRALSARDQQDGGGDAK